MNTQRLFRPRGRRICRIACASCSSPFRYIHVIVAMVIIECKLEYGDLITALFALVRIAFDVIGSCHIVVVPYP
ncbi:unnamed protein product [Haemonchus placei]|uniref:Transmembrane protein n=1 Tax=Haemonchus placei TaxID=6290 RepID=A0A0N4X2S0_HAEPC|nr:unnamed protein product [Haemonchus placei]